MWDAERPGLLLTPQSSGQEVVHPSLLYPGINSPLSPASLKRLLMLLVHPWLRQSSPSGKETSIGD